MPKDPKEYREIIQKSIRAKSSLKIFNDDETCAQIIIDEMFKNAEISVKIFCKNLLKCVYDSEEILESAFRASVRGVKIEIITQEEPQATEFEKYAELDESVTIYDGSKLIKNDLNQLDHNYALMDDRAYRFEPVNNIAEAFACMNDRDSVKSLSALFDRSRELFV